MLIAAVNSTTAETKPFVIEHLRHNEQPSGQFIPGAHLMVTPVLRTSGLLADLPDGEAKTLLLILTFLTPNGHIRPSLPELAQALRTSLDKARKRMQRLESLSFEGEPLAYSRTAESGRETWSLSALLIGQREAPMVEAPAPIYQAASREAVIAHSRTHYAVPRAEAERQVAAQYGQDGAETGEGKEAQARRALLALGVSRDQVTQLFTGHPLEDIQQQLEWLPQRGANSPSRFIVAAIQGHYDPPARVRLERSAIDENARESERGIAEENEAPQGMTADVFLEIPLDVEAEKGAADAD